MRYKITHSVTTDYVGSTCATYYPHTKFYENRSLYSHQRSKALPFLLTSNLHPSIHTYTSIHPHIHPYIQTVGQQKSIMGPSSIAGGPRKKKKKNTKKHTHTQKHTFYPHFNVQNMPKKVICVYLRTFWRPFWKTSSIRHLPKFENMLHNIAFYCFSFSFSFSFFFFFFLHMKLVF